MYEPLEIIIIRFLLIQVPSFVILTLYFPRPGSSEWLSFWSSCNYRIALNSRTITGILLQVMFNHEIKSQELLRFVLNQLCLPFRILRIFPMFYHKIKFVYNNGKFILHRVYSQELHPRTYKGRLIRPNNLYIYL